MGDGSKVLRTGDGSNTKFGWLWGMGTRLKVVCIEQATAAARLKVMNTDSFEQTVAALHILKMHWQALGQSC